MNFDYIEERLKPQMTYYQQKAISLRKEYYFISYIIIIFNAIIPILTIGLEATGALKYIIACISATVAALSSILLLRGTKELWICFRGTYEKLEKEKTLLLTSSGEYNSQNIELLILNCEKIMESEHNSWEKYNSKNFNKQGD